MARKRSFKNRQPPQSIRDPYQELANAIILQAVKDYRPALNQIAKSPKDHQSQSTKRECERFFLSPWFHTLTELNPHMLIRDLQQEVM